MTFELLKYELIDNESLEAFLLVDLFKAFAILDLIRKIYRSDIETSTSTSPVTLLLVDFF